ncbi:MAG: hypothetical protein LUK37_17590 [Clostridia bacterium]|nr:hypothetical protein [Clostridia bacterium]
MDIKKLLKDIEKGDYQELYKYETDIYLSLYQKTIEGRPSCVTAFLVISSWFGTSQRSGVWTFYEATKSDEIHTALQYLKESGENVIAQIFEKGIHDYHNPIYAENFDYPEKWIEEADEIDNWIMQHEELLWKWEYKLLMDNKQVIAAL